MARSGLYFRRFYCPNSWVHYTDLLIKPSNSMYLKVEEIQENVSALKEFDLLGVTEKELGKSLVERLKTLVSLRSMLAEANLDIPIHIFGCLDPTSVWLFYLCGADVFDGLSWLRFAYHQNMPVYRNAWAAIEGHGHLLDPELHLLAMIHNLGSLREQRTSMITFYSDFEITRIPISVEKLTRLLGQVGVKLPKGTGIL